MFINQNIVAIFFKLLNFTILIGLVTFIFKKYFKTNIMLLIAKKESDYQNLIAQQTVLEDKQRNLDILMREETIQCQNFKSKIDEWKRVVISKQQKQTEEYDNFLAIIKKRNAKIILKKENQRLQNNIIDMIVSDLEISLSDNFKNSQKSTDYLSNVVRFMKEKTS